MSTIKKTLTKEKRHAIVTCNGEKMEDTNERQRKFREKMYKAGFKPMQIWVKRKESKQTDMNIRFFVGKLKKLTADWDKNRLSILLNLLLKIVKASNEEVKLKKK